MSKPRVSDFRITDTEGPFLDLHLTISDGFVSSKIYDKRDDFDFDNVNFPFLDGNIPRAHHTRFTFLNLFGLPVADFTTRNKI